MKKLKEAQIADVPEENTPVDSKKTKRKSVINTIVNVVLIVAIVLAAISTYISFVASSGSGVPSFFGVQLLSVQTDSMKDTLMYLTAHYIKHLINSGGGVRKMMDLLLYIEKNKDKIPSTKGVL